jgi:hypothetical protein
VFIAHAPSGYILAVSLIQRIRKIAAPQSWVIAAGVIGALAPDFDIAYFYLIDHRQTHHHKYLSHWPMVWLALLVVSALWLRLSKKPTIPFLSLVFSLGGFLHIILDSFVGDIWWLAPFVDKPYAMFAVQAHYHPWWLNFILHWSFAAELLICIWAVILYRKRIKASI